VARTQLVFLVLLLFISEALAARVALAERGGRFRAAIDMGSSGIKMVVVDGRGRTVLDEKIGVSLGKGIGPDKLLPKVNRERAVDALKTFIGRAGQFGIPASEIELVTTAAVRNAKGRVTAAARAEGKSTGRQFIADEVRAGLGLVRARILTGRQEALLGHEGALAGWKGTGRGRFVVIDTGGGSHQVIVGTRKTVAEAGSTQIGSNFVAEKVVVDAHGTPIDVLTHEDLAQADRRMAAAIPRLPEGVGDTRGLTPVLTGGVSKYLHHYFRKDSVTREEIEALRVLSSTTPMGPSRGELVRRDVHGKSFNVREQKLLGLHEAGAKSGDYGGKLTAKLTLLLRVMSLVDTPMVHLSQTDARHALAK
jgi:hypothetical protein